VVSSEVGINVVATRVKLASECSWNPAILAALSKVIEE
jgi:hypothetical protein